MRRPLGRVLDVLLADRRSVTATSAFDERLQIGPTTSVERNGDSLAQLPEKLGRSGVAASRAW
jgi:hypothetical protein